MYGCFTRRLEKDCINDHNSSQARTKNRKLLSHIERSISAIPELELLTKFLMNK